MKNDVSIPVEREFLGALLACHEICGESKVSTARRYVRPDDFNLATHRRVFQEICGLDARADHVNVASVADALLGDREFQSWGGVAELARLKFEGGTSTAQIGNLASRVREHADRRRAIARAEQFIADTKGSPLGLGTTRELAAGLARDLPELVESVEDDGEEGLPLANPWPDSLPAEALHGLSGDFVRLVEPHSEADPAALLGQFHIAAGSVIGRGSHFLIEADEHHGNLFAVLVGETSLARKGTSWGHVRRFFAQVDPIWGDECVTSGLSSGEGVIWHVRDQAGDDAGVLDKRRLFEETEFASLLRRLAREGNTLSPVLRNAWDTGRLSTATKHSSIRAIGAHVSIIGHVTKDEVLRYLDRTEVANGFGNRFLWMCVRRSKVLAEGGTVPGDQLEQLVRRVRNSIDQARKVGRIGFDERAKKLWYSVYEGLTAGSPGMLGAILARGAAQVLRLATLYALLDASHTIQEEHLRAGLGVWSYCEQSARHIFGEALGDPLADALLKLLRASSAGLTRTEIRDAFGRNRSEAQVSRALASLQAAGFAHLAKKRAGGSGRPPERWMATTQRPKRPNSPPSPASVVSVVGPFSQGGPTSEPSQAWESADSDWIRDLQDQAEERRAIRDADLLRAGPAQTSCKARIS